MVTSYDLEYKIFLDAETDPRGLTDIITMILSGEAPEEDRRDMIRTPYSEIYVVDNEFFDEDARKNFPGGFIAFRYFLEVYPMDEHRRDKRKAEIALLLERLWALGISAVAASDDEDELPQRGGYASKSIPWPR